MRPALLALVTGVLIALGANTAVAESPEVCGRVPPTNLPIIRGYTWTGTVTRLGAHGAITFSVEHVYADESTGAPPVGRFEAGSSLRLGNRSCNPISGLAVGRRYLVSTHSVSTDGPQTAESVIWELDGDRASFLHMYANEFHLPAQFVAADTLGEALALVAPGAVLPPTDAAQSTPARIPLAPPVVLALASAAAVAWSIGRRRVGGRCRRARGVSVR